MALSKAIKIVSHIFVDQWNSFNIPCSIISGFNSPFYCKTTTPSQEPQDEFKTNA